MSKTKFRSLGVGFLLSAIFLALATVAWPFVPESFKSQLDSVHLPLVTDTVKTTEETTAATTQAKQTTETTTNKQEEIKKEELPELDKDDDESEEPDKDFEEFEDSGIFIRRDYRKNISIESENEDMFVRCFKIVTGKFKITNEQTLKEINEFNGDNKLKLNTEYTFISLPLEIENLSKYDYEYASSLAISLLNTKEQLNADKYFSDETDTYKILSGAIVERDLVFIVEKSNIEDVTDIRLKLPDLYIEEIEKTVPGLELNINIK